MMRNGPVVLSLASLMMLGACRKAAPDLPPEGGSVANDLSESPVLHRRCAPEGASAPIPGGETVVIGDAIAFGNEWFLGTVRADEAGLRGKVLRASRDLSKLAELDVCSPDGDAPPPRVFRRGGGVSVACYTRPAGGRKKGRELSIYDIAGEKVSLVTTVAQGNDDAFWFDVASTERGAFVVWTEDDAKAEKPLVRSVRIAAEGKVDAPKTLASPDGDVDAPRVMATEAGMVVAWVAVKREGFAPSDASLEGAGEARFSSWVEWMPLDAAGVPLAAPKAATKKTHVTWFALARRGASAEAFFVDEQAKSEGGGGRIGRVSFLEAPESESEVLPAGVGSAFPDLFLGEEASGRAWLAFTDVAEHAKILPFSLGGPRATPIGEPTDEVAFARPLAAAADRVLGLVFSDPVGGKGGAAPPRLRVSTCIP